MSRLKELKKKEEAALTAGGPDAAKNQHKAGKKTARERITALVDAASFVEIDKFVKGSTVSPGRESVSEVGEGVVCGYGTVDGRPVFVYAQDYTVLAGSVSVAHARKILKVMDMAATSGIPVIGIIDSGGARIAEGVAAVNSYAAILKKLNEISGVVPTICVVAGSCIGTAAYIAATMDFCFTIDKISKVALHGPQIYQATFGDEIDVKTAFSAKAANEVTGVSQFLAASEDECYAELKKLLGYLPSNNLESSPYEVGSDDLNRQLAGFDEAYEPKALIQNVSDGGACLEYQAFYGTEIVTAFGRINGNAVGFVANGTEGRISPHAARKASRFVSILDAYNIPIITFTNLGGTDVSLKQRCMTTAGAGLIAAYAGCGSPMLNVITGEAVGDGYAMMCPKALGADLVYAWPQAVITAMPPEAGALLLYEKDIEQAQDGVKAKQDAVAKYREEYANPWQAAEQGVVDDVIEPARTRQMLIAGLEMCQTKRVQRLPKKHDVKTL
ncbi:MAG: methylmalonyl-CoA carboxyltransferase [Clostridia bacterium]|nr:methylmalonyl-CoA carboxyltransferase [Clostridia bacterium]